MKKFVWLFILLLIPFVVGAEGKDLYKDLRQNAISNNQLQEIDENVYIFKGGTSNNLANFVRFNNELWRIMGIYNNQLKIIHANSIGRYQFDYGSMKITYPGSELSVYLNGSYLNSINANDKLMIDENGKWYVGNTENSSKAATAYSDAKKETLTETVGIMATYEFLYASNGNNCYNVNGSSYNSSCGGAAYDWLTPAEHDAWTLTTYYYNEEHTRGVPLNISPSGYVSAGSGNAASLWIYPSLYLKTNIKIVSGSGTSSDPFILGTYYANSINVEEKEGTDSINFEIDNLTEVEYQTEVIFNIKVVDGYKLKEIKIIDSNNEEIEYNLINGQYKFIMPNSDVTIIPVYDKGYSFIEGMGQTYNISKDSKMRFRVDMEYDDFVDGGKVFIDNEEIDCNCYDLSEGSTIIVFKDECSKKYKVGNHEIVAKLSNGKTASTDFYIKANYIDNPIINKITNPDTFDKVLIVIFVLILSIMVYVVIKKRKYSSN